MLLVRQGQKANRKQNSFVSFQTQVLPALWKLRQEDFELEAIFKLMVQSRIA